MISALVSLPPRVRAVINILMSLSVGSLSLLIPRNPFLSESHWMKVSYESPFTGSEAVKSEFPLKLPDGGRGRVEIFSSSSLEPDFMDPDCTGPDRMHLPQAAGTSSL